MIERNEGIDISRRALLLNGSALVLAACTSRINDNSLRLGEPLNPKDVFPTDWRQISRLIQEGGKRDGNTIKLENILRRDKIRFNELPLPIQIVGRNATDIDLSAYAPSFSQERGFYGPDANIVIYAAREIPGSTQYRSATIYLGSPFRVENKISERSP